MKMKKPNILVVNDDGIFAPGIKALVAVAREFGNVIVVAPDSPQSAKGHSITISEILRLRKVDLFEGVEAYECSGTPVDCIKMAKHIVMKDQSIDLVVSGINHGTNASISIIYSGTMSAAMEASHEGLKAIGFSHVDHSYQIDFTAAQHFVRYFIAEALKEDYPGGRLLNVNIPNLPLSEIKGIKVCRQAKGSWQENFLENTDPSGKTYYWLTGRFVMKDEGSDTDIHALEEGYVSVVPSTHDLTDYEGIDIFKAIFNDNRES
jgi:5'-nucleotidase